MGGLSYDLRDVTNESFAALMNIAPVELPHTPDGLILYQSTSQPFQPMKGIGNVFGGHVLGQAVVAAGTTVQAGLVCHTSSSYFLRPGIPQYPFLYAVEKLRDGSRYCTRSVRVYQIPEEELPEFRFQNSFLRFVGLLSFKLSEDSTLDFQAPPKPEFDLPDHEIIQMEMAPDVDTPMLQDYLHGEGIESQWHCIDCRKMDTTQYNEEKDPTERRIVHFFRSGYQLPNSVHLHVALLLYLSDRNSLFTLFNIWKNPWVLIEQLASLNHTFILHNLDPVVDNEYLTMETWTDRAYDSRGLYNGRMFDKAGRLIASFVQDGVVKVRLEQL